MVANEVVLACALMQARDAARGRPGRTGRHRFGDNARVAITERFDDAEFC
jgi:hypothetical protein